MAWITGLIFGVIALILLMYLLQPDSKGMPPGPVGLPFVGYLFSLLWEDPNKLFNRLSETHGPLFSVQIGFKRVVVINSQKWLNQAFVRQGDHFNHRPQGTVLTFIMRGKGIAMAEDEIWKDMRKFTLAVFKDFGLGKNGIENYVGIELQDFMTLLKEKEGKIYNPHYDIGTSILNIVWHMIVGKRFPMGDETLKWIIDSLEMSLTLVEQGGFLNYTPLIQFIGTFCKPRAVKVGKNVFHRLEYFRGLIKQHKDTMDDPNRGFDLMYEYLEERKKQLNAENTDTNFTEEQLMWLVSDLFIVGLDTTVTTLRWALLFLVRDQRVQEKVYKEVISAFPDGELPTYQRRLETPYLEAFINEVLRYGTITPLAAHASPCETTLGSYRIPKRTWVIGNLWGIHWDKSVWGDPQNFRPERFINEDGSLMKNENMVAFSLGRRNCLGEHLARVEVYMYVASMLQKYKFLPVNKDSIPYPEYVCGVTLNPKDFDLIMKPRL